MNNKKFLPLLVLSISTFIIYILILISIYNVLIELTSEKNYNIIVTLGVIATVLIIISTIIAVINSSSYKGINMIVEENKLFNQRIYEYKDVKRKMITAVIKVIIIIFVIIHFTAGAIIGLFSLSSYKSDLRYKNNYGTIKLFLKYESFSSNYYYIDWKNKKNDEDGVIYYKLYDLDFEEIKRKDYLNHKSGKGFEYSIPYDDYAYIYLADNGYGYISIGPDLSPTYDYYFKTKEEDAYNLYLLVEERLSNNVEK